MPKTKPQIKSIVVGSIHGDKQEVYINGFKYEFSIYHHASEIVSELAKHFDFSYQDEKDFEVMW